VNGLWRSSLPEAAVQQYTQSLLQKRKKEQSTKYGYFGYAPFLALRPSNIFYTILFPDITNLVTDSKIVFRLSCD
jgi:hypothetical protein